MTRLRNNKKRNRNQIAFVWQHQRTIYADTRSATLLTQLNKSTVFYGPAHWFQACFYKIKPINRIYAFLHNNYRQLSYTPILKVLQKDTLLASVLHTRSFIDTQHIYLKRTTLSWSNQHQQGFEVAKHLIYKLTSHTITYLKYLETTYILSSTRFSTLFILYIFDNQT